MINPPIYITLCYRELVGGIFDNFSTRLLKVIFCFLCVVIYMYISVKIILLHVHDIALVIMFDL